MAQKLYLDGNDNIVVLDEQDLERMDPDERSGLRETEPEDILIRVFKDVNPNFEYVFGEKPHLLEDYFHKKHKDLPHLLCTLWAGEEIDILKIGNGHERYKDPELRSHIYYFMDNDRPEYKILDNKLRLRIQIINREAVPIIKGFHKDMSYNPEAKSLTEKIAKIEKNLEMWKTKLGVIESYPLPPSYGPEYLEEVRHKKEIKQFVYGAVPLWFN
jgi:hypothetical protein